jgi:hypothetical protein
MTAPVAGAQQWIMQPLPAGNAAKLAAVSCTSGTACMAVGNWSGPPTYGQLPLAERWDGQSWIVESPVMRPGAISVVLTGVSCVSSTDCIAVGMST